MTNIALKLWNDDAGFVVSAELVLVSTIAVLAMVVGLSEVSYGIVQELEDTGAAFGSINQSFRYTGICGHYGHVAGTIFTDVVDFCDQPNNIVGTTPTAEGYTN